MTMCSESISERNLSGSDSSMNNVTVTKTPDTTNRNPNRRSNKPIMEKRRRARINNCLNELKGILLEAMRKDPARHSKLEKADILELTVSHLKGLHRNQNSGGDGTQYRQGFAECAAEVGRFLSSSTAVDGIDPQTSSRLLSHLAECINSPSFTIQNGTTNNIPTITNATISNNQHQQQQQHSSSLSLNSHHNLSSNNLSNNNNNSNNSHGPIHNTPVTAIDTHGSATTTINVPANTPIISLVPSRLSSGEIAFVVPGFSSATAAHHQQQQHHHHHHHGSSSTPSPSIPLAAMQSLHCNPQLPMLSPEVPLELTVPSSSSSGCSLSPNYPVGHGSFYHHQHLSHPHLHYPQSGSYSPPQHHYHSSSQPLALVTPKKEESESCWRPWG